MVDPVLFVFGSREPILINIYTTVQVELNNMYITIGVNKESEKL
jgi:hypothetical protein